MKLKFVASMVLLILSIASLSYGIDFCQDYLNKGEYDKAVDVCTTMIKSSNGQTYANYYNRGFAYSKKGQYDKDSVRDYRKLLEIFTKERPDTKLDLLYVRLLNSSVKLSKDDYDQMLTELRSYVSSHDVSSDDEKWWRTISKYYLGIGDLTDSKLLYEAKNGKDEKAVRHRLCDAYYSIGEKRLMEKDVKGAKEFFNKSAETNVPSYSSRYAKAMLRLLQEGKL